MRRRPRRRWWVPLTSVVVVLLALGGVTLAHDSNSPRPTVATSSFEPPVPGVRPARSGITFGAALFGLSRRELDAALDDVVALHMTWIRIDISWAAIQPQSARRYQWQAVDTVVAAARRRSLQVLALITYTPPWARAPGCRTFVCPPRRVAAFATFAASTVRRYAAAGVRTYQLWNEPNIAEFWTRPDATAYGTLLRSSVRAMRREQDGLTIVFGALGYTGGVTSASLVAPEVFLRSACATARCDVDAVALDPFTYPDLPGTSTAPSDAWSLVIDPGEGSAGLVAAEAAVGLAGVPIWITAFGAPTTYPGGTSRRLTTPTQQRDILVDGAGLAARHKDVIGAFFVDTLRDRVRVGTLRDHFGLIASDGRRKPSFAALERELRR